MSIAPTAAVSAAADPDIPAKNILATMDTAARPPDIHPTRASAKFTILLEIPPESIRAPASIKRGTAIRGKESTALTIL